MCKCNKRLGGSDHSSPICPTHSISTTVSMPFVSFLETLPQPSPPTSISAAAITTTTTTSIPYPANLFVYFFEGLNSSRWDPSYSCHVSFILMLVIKIIGKRERECTWLVLGSRKSCDHMCSLSFPFVFVGPPFPFIFLFSMSINLSTPDHHTLFLLLIARHTYSHLACGRLLHFPFHHASTCHMQALIASQSPRDVISE